MTATLSTHVLDTATGRPAAGIRVRLESGAASTALGAGTTDADGRIRDFGPAAATLAPGSYALVFEVGGYFAAAKREAFWREIRVAFEVTGGGHHHVPLLLSPFGYSTYRGS
jgi:5-hydroxyisourate hydrolase